MKKINKDILNSLTENIKDTSLKVLACGKLTKKLTVKANAFSAGATEKITAVGGKAEVI